MAFHSLYFLLTLSITCHTVALRVTPDSPCSSQCTDSSPTAAANIVCGDADLTATSTGVEWKQCMSCLQNSTYSEGDESDQGWFLCEQIQTRRTI